MIYLFAIILAIIGVAVTITLASYWKLMADEALEYRSATKGFFAAAKPVVSDDETPVEILEIVNVMNNTITDKRAASSILAYIVHERWKSREPTVENKIIVEFFHRRPELEDPFRDMFVQWFRSITSLSPVIGIVARVAMSERNIETAVIRRAEASQCNCDLPLSGNFATSG